MHSNVPTVQLVEVSFYRLTDENATSTHSCIFVVANHSIYAQFIVIANNSLFS